MKHRQVMTAVAFGFVGILSARMLPAPAGPAAAQGGPIRCSAFLHMRDGSWRSFEEADFAGPSGVTHIESGEVLRSTQKSAKGEIARALDAICDSP